MVFLSSEVMGYARVIDPEMQCPDNLLQISQKMFISASMHNVYTAVQKVMYAINVELLNEFNQHFSLPFIF